MIMNEFGVLVDEFFNNILNWTYSNGILFFTGRDLMCIGLGVAVGVLMTSSVIVYGNTRRFKHDGYNDSE